MYQKLSDPEPSKGQYRPDYSVRSTVVSLRISHGCMISSSQLRTPFSASKDRAVDEWYDLYLKTCLYCFAYEQQEKHSKLG